ncbi:16144_t:CDS:2, partial [Gigaspora rosea]
MLLKPKPILLKISSKHEVNIVGARQYEAAVLLNHPFEYKAED